MTSVRIDLVYDRECPHLEEARAMIRAALAEVGEEIDWLEWDREDARTPEELRRYGSPTVLVNDRDVSTDDVRSSRADASACRIYYDECACICGAPPAAVIASAIRKSE